MSQENGNSPDDRADVLLEKVIVGFRERKVPRFPHVSVVLPASTSPSRVARERSPRTRFVMNRLVQIVSVAVVVLGLLTVASVISSRPTVAFAQSQEALREVQSYEFQRSFGDVTSERVMVLDEFRSRRERRGALQDGLHVTILDWRQERALLLNMETRTAQIMAIYPSPDVMLKLRDVVSHLTRVSERATRVIGEKQLGGVDVIEYAVDDREGEQIVAIDVDSKLPVRTEWVGMKGAPPEMSIVDSNYDFEVTFDDSLFSLTPPEGYTVVNQVEPRGQQPTDETLRDLVVTPSGGIGDVTFGMTKMQVVQIFGRPDGIELIEVLAPTDPIFDRPGSGSELVYETMPAEKLLYNSRGFQLTVSDMFGLETVECFGPPLSGMFVREFLGKTGARIRMGATREDLVDAYGEPNLQHPVARVGEETLGYVIPEAGNASMTFRLRDGCLCGMTLGTRVTDKSDAPDLDGTEQRLDDSGNGEASIETSETSAEEGYAQLVNEYEQQLESLQAESASQASAEQRQALARRRLHLPEGYAARFLALAEQYPKETTSFDANCWVILNVIDLSHPAVKKSLANVIRRHTTNTGLDDIIMRARFGDDLWERVLREILANNSDRRMQGLACFALGQNLVRQATRTVSSSGDRTRRQFAIASAEEREQRTDEGEQLFERVVSEFSDVEWRARCLGELSEAFLKSLRSPVAIGTTVPEIGVLSAEGDHLALSDFRGRVVVLQFSANWCAACKAMYPMLRQLVDDYGDDQLVVLGVMADSSVDTILKAKQDEDIAWPVWHDGEEGPITAEWGIRAFPTLIVIDADGVVVERGNQLDLAIICALAESD